MRHISNYSSSQSMGPTEILQVGTSLKILPHKEPPPPTTHTHMEKIASKGKLTRPLKRRKEALHMEKTSPHSIVVSRGWRAPTLAPLLRAPMSECDYIKCTMFSVIIHHIIISKYTLECTQLNYLLKIFLEEHTLESSINKIEQRYTHSTINNERGMYYNTTPLAKKLHPPVWT